MNKSKENTRVADFLAISEEDQRLKIAMGIENPQLYEDFIKTEEINYDYAVAAKILSREDVDWITGKTRDFWIVTFNANDVDYIVEVKKGEAVTFGTDSETGNYLINAEIKEGLSGDGQWFTDNTYTTTVSSPFIPEKDTTLLYAVVGE